MNETVKYYRILNRSNQTVYIQLTTRFIGLSSNSSIDIPESEISYHVRIMARRGHVGLFERLT